MRKIGLVFNLQEINLDRLGYGLFGRIKLRANLYNFHKSIRYLLLMKW